MTVNNNGNDDNSNGSNVSNNDHIIVLLHRYIDPSLKQIDDPKL